MPNGHLELSFEDKVRVIRNKVNLIRTMNEEIEKVVEETADLFVKYILPELEERSKNPAMDSKDLIEWQHCSDYAINECEADPCFDCTLLYGGWKSE